MGDVDGPMLDPCNFMSIMGKDLQDLHDFDKIYRSFSWKIPEFYNLAHDIYDKHSFDINKVTLFYESNDGKEANYTFSQLNRLSYRLANAS